MKNSHSFLDNTKLLAAIATYADELSAEDRVSACSPGPHLIARQTGNTYWSLIVRLDGRTFRACTGTGDRLKARAIAAAIQADADARRFVQTTAPTDARVLALLAMMNRRATHHRTEAPSENMAHDGQPGVRIAGS